MAVTEKWEQSLRNHVFEMWLGTKELDNKRSGAIDTILQN